MQEDDIIRLRRLIRESLRGVIRESLRTSPDRERIELGLQLITPRAAKLIRFIDFDMRSYKDGVEKFGVSSANVFGSLLQSARSQLKKAVADKTAEELRAEIAAAPQRSKEIPYAQADLETALDDFADEEETVEDLLSSKEDAENARRRIEIGLRLITPRYAKAIELRILDGMTREEAAVAIGIELRNFDVLFHRAMASLAKVMSEKSSEELQADEESHEFAPTGFRRPGPAPISLTDREKREKILNKARRRRATYAAKKSSM
jgi:DNA-directed RNA polymerase specialized sigma24 family protein